MRFLHVCRTRIGPSAPGPTPGHPGAVYVGSCSYVNYAKFIPIPPRTNPSSTRPRERLRLTENRKTSVLDLVTANCSSNARVGLLGPLPLPRTLRTIVPHETVRLAYRRGCVVHVGPRAAWCPCGVRRAGGRRAGVTRARDPLLDKASLHTLLTHYAPISPLKALNTNPAIPARVSADRAIDRRISLIWLLPVLASPSGKAKGVHGSREITTSKARSFNILLSPRPTVHASIHRGAALGGSVHSFPWSGSRCDLCTVSGPRVRATHRRARLRKLNANASVGSRSRSPRGAQRGPTRSRAQHASPQSNLCARAIGA